MGTLALGLAMYRGVGTLVNSTRAASYFHAVAGKVPEASFYLGEMLMGKVYGDVENVAAFIARLREGRVGGGVLGPMPEYTDGKKDTSLAGATGGKGSWQHAQHPQDDPSGADSSGRGSGGRKAARGGTVGGSKPQIDPVGAFAAYSNAAQRGHTIALQRLGHMLSQGIGENANCASALNAFKTVAEKGPWAFDLATAAKLHHAGGGTGRRSLALGLYAQLASVGMDMAQTNAATLLVQLSEKRPVGWTAYSPILLPSRDALAPGGTVDVSTDSAMLGALPEPRQWIGQGAGGNGRPRLAVEVRRQEEHEQQQLITSAASMGYRGVRRDTRERTARTDLASVAGRSLAVDKTEAEVLPQAGELRAFHLFLACAEQGRADAHMKVGDFYFYGLAGLPPDGAAAAARYKTAADLRHPHAIFNLGLMYEAGMGVKQDFHLAKRFYDQAAEFDTAARIPRSLALLMLQSHQTLQDMLGGEEVLNAMIDAAYVVPIVTHALSVVRMVEQTVAAWWEELNDIEWSAILSSPSSSPSSSSASSLSHLLALFSPSANTNLDSDASVRSKAGSGSAGNTATKDVRDVEASARARARAQSESWGVDSQDFPPRWVRLALHYLGGGMRMLVSAARTVASSRTGYPWVDMILRSFDRWGTVCLLLCGMLVSYARWSARYHERMDALEMDRGRDGPGS